MEFVQALLLVIIVDILINTLVSYLSKALGHILKMFNPWNNNNNNKGANNDPNGNNPYGNNPNGNNPYGNNPNGNNPNGNNDYYNIVEGDNPNERQRRRIAKDYSNYEETRRVARRIFYETKNSELGEGVETTFDSRGRKISKIYWNNILINGILKKQITKEESYTKKGVLYEAVVLKDGIETNTYYHKRSFKFT